MRPSLLCMTKDFVAAEKKPLVIDLENSTGSYMQSIAPESHCILDGASQIASLALGFNHALKNPMGLRPETLGPLSRPQDFSLKDWQNWDVYQAYTHLLKKTQRFRAYHLCQLGLRSRWRQPCGPVKASSSTAGGDRL